MRAALAALLLVPFLAAAQEDALRAQIRADLMQDPNTAQLSNTERDALVEALAQEAESNGEAGNYLDAQTAPTFTYDAPPAPQSTLDAVLSAPIVIAFFAFLAALASIVLFMLRRKGNKAVDLHSARE